MWREGWADQDTSWDGGQWLIWAGTVENWVPKLSLELELSSHSSEMTELWSTRNSCIFANHICATVWSFTLTTCVKLTSFNVYRWLQAATNLELPASFAHVVELCWNQQPHTICFFCCKCCCTFANLCINATILLISWLTSCLFPKKEWSHLIYKSQNSQHTKNSLQSIVHHICHRQSNSLFYKLSILY